MLLSGTMFYVEAVLSKAFDQLSDFTYWLFEGFQPLQSAVVGSNFKLSAENIATEAAQRVDERKHFLANHCVF